jgi:Protein of unknown function (DUF2500)
MEFVEIMFVLVPIFMGVVFLFILFQMGKGIAEWSRNNSLPVLAEPARVVTKRSQTTGNVSTNTGGQVSTWYYATFELESGERREFTINGGAYGQLAEGDEGTLTYQGTRYHGFQRHRR